MICCIILLFTLTSCVSGSFLVEVTQTSYQAEENLNVTLEWRFSPRTDGSLHSIYFWCVLSPGPESSVLFHVHKGVEVPKSQDERFAGRVQWDKDALREGLVRLQVSRLRTDDSGVYLCSVNAGDGSASEECHLNVTARDQTQPETPRSGGGDPSQTGSPSQPESPGWTVLHCLLGLTMSWRSSFRCSKFRHVFGKPSTKERGYDGVPIARSVHDNHSCSANPCFLAVVTECAGGGSFLVLPIHHTGRVDPQHPRVCGHSGRVLDVKWNPFDDHCIASCSEDCTVKIWDIPVCGVQQNLTKARTTLIGHSRRVALIEWHPTAENLLLSSAYDYKVLLWDVSQGGAVLRYPVRVVLMPIHHRYPSDALLLSVSFNSDGSRLAVTSKDRRVRVLDPRTGRILQVSSSKTHRASKVLYIGGLKMLLSTGSSPWNHRQIVLWDPDDLSEPLFEEDLDGSAGVLFPFYDPDTHMLYLAGKGDGNIRYYELSTEKPYISFLSECRSLLPQKGLGVMPKRGLDVSACEVFRFYRLIAIKDLVEPLSMIVPRKESDAFQEDLFPMTAGNQAAMTAQEWLLGVNRSPVLMSLKPGTRVTNPYPETPAEKGLVRQLSCLRFQMDLAVVAVTGPNLDIMEEDTSTWTGGAEDRTADPLKDDQLYKTPIFQQTTMAFFEEELAYQDAKYPGDMSGLSGWQPDETHIPLWTYCCTPHCCEPAERPPPTAESELLQAFYRQQDELRGLREQVNAKDVRITQLELDLNNTRNNMRATF